MLTKRDLTFKLSAALAALCLALAALAPTALADPAGPDGPAGSGRALTIVEEAVPDEAAPDEAAPDEAVPDAGQTAVGPAVDAALPEGAESGTWGTCEWEIVDGTLTIHPGTGADTITHDSAPWYGSRGSITAVVCASEGGEKVVAPASCFALFAGFGKAARMDLSGLDTSKVERMTCMFDGCSSLASLDLSSWVTSSVAGMGCMFSGCTKLSSLVLSSWNTAKVTDMTGMFYNCSSLTSLDLSGWDTSKVEDMGYMFYNCSSLTSLDLSGWDTSKVERMTCMFNGCESLTSLDLSGWDTSKVEDAEDMFSDCKSLGLFAVGEKYETGDDGALFPNATVTSGWWSGKAGKWLTKDEICPGRSGVADVYLSREAVAAGRWGTCIWVIETGGTLSIGPGVGADTITYNSAPWYGHRIKVTAVAFRAEGGKKVVAPSLCKYLFNGQFWIKWMDLSGLDTSSVTNMTSMFDGCGSLASLDLSGLDTSKVEDMGYMFSGCTSLSSLDLTGLDTSKVEDMNFMFEGCDSLASLDLSGLDTSLVRSMGSMFAYCSSLPSLDLSGWDTSKVEDMSDMFDGCSSLASLDLSGWVTSSATDMGSMFSDCAKLTSLDLSGWDTSKVGDAEDMFSGCKSLASLKVGEAYAIKGADMFPQATAASGWWWSVQDGAWRTRDEIVARRSRTADTYLSKDPTDNVASGRWGSCPWSIDKDGTLAIRPGEGEGTSSAGDAPWHDYCDSVTSVACAAEREGEDKIVAPASCFGLFAGLGRATSMDLTGLDTSKVEDMQYMFIVCSSLASLDLSGWDTSKVTDMTGMFDGCSSLTSLNLSGWKTSKVTDMSEMFFVCKALTALDLSGLDTSSVTDMKDMFHSCEDLSSLDLSGWKTSKVTNMRSMFSGCKSLSSLDLSGLVTSSVTVMGTMFSGCGNLSTLDLSGLDTSSVTDMGYMFAGCGALSSLDLSGFDTSKVANAEGMFNGCGSLGLFAVGEKYKAEDGVLFPDANATSGWWSGKAGKWLTKDEIWPGRSGVADVYLSREVVAAGRWGTCIWVIETDGTLSIGPGVGADTNNTGDAPWHGYRDKVTAVVCRAEGGKKAVAPAWCVSLFDGLDKATIIDLSGLDTSKVTNMDFMFHGCEALSALDLTGWDTSSATDMNEMFCGCEDLASLDLSGWDTSKVERMTGMFSGCKALSSLTVGAGYAIKGADMFPNAPNAISDGGKWWSVGDGKWYAKSDIVAGRSGVPDTYLGRLSISAAAVRVGDQAYTGRPLRPTVTVTLDGRDLVAGTDYTVSYKNNRDVGTATVVVKGKGGYEGTTRGTFEIRAADISGARVSVSAQAYTGRALRPSATVTLAGRELVAGTDYELSYEGNVDAGTATVTVKGRGNYYGAATGSFKIRPASLASARVSVARQAYTGRAVEPAARVRLGGRALVAGTDYAVTYRDNVRAGTAIAVVRGRGNYRGAAKATFAIVAPTVSYTAHLQRTGWEGSWDSDGEPSGTTGQSRRLEAFRLELGRGFPVGGGIRYKSRVRGSGWEAWRADGQLSGTVGQSRRIEAVRVALSGDMARAYDVWYRVHVQRLGWLGWAKNGGVAGSFGYGYRVEAVQVVLVPKGVAAPAATYKGVTQWLPDPFVRR